MNTRSKNPNAPLPTVIIEVRGGIATVTQQVEGVRVVILDHDTGEPAEPVTCSICDWSGDRHELEALAGIDLTDYPRAAGRCPDCDQIAYRLKDVGFRATLRGPKVSA